MKTIFDRPKPCPHPRRVLVNLSSKLCGTGFRLECVWCGDLTHVKED